jgi:hypothetical protein
MTHHRRSQVDALTATGVAFKAAAMGQGVGVTAPLS